MKKSSTLLAGLILSLAVSAHATIVTTYTDNFEGTITQRSVTEGAVTSFAWYTRNNGAFSYSNGKMITTSDRGGIGYFMAPGESFTLTNIGDKIELRVDFTFTGSGSDSATDRMRIGLLGQGATRIADNWGTNDSIAQAEGITGFVGTWDHGVRVAIPLQWSPIISIFMNARIRHQPDWRHRRIG
ncbi:MAG: hypothetical protein LR015_07775 [Verrucomicrobia bacterium]|nr:hypothetical protein [Verrucomicrobiota bacterium]